MQSVGYAPADNPKIAVMVIVEHGGYGSSSAGPIARKMMDAYLLPKPEVLPEQETSLEQAKVQQP